MLIRAQFRKPGMSWQDFESEVDLPDGEVMLADIENARLRAVWPLIRAGLEYRNVVVELSVDPVTGTPRPYAMWKADAAGVDR